MFLVFIPLSFRFEVNYFQYIFCMLAMWMCVINGLFQLVKMVKRSVLRTRKRYSVAVGSVGTKSDVFDVINNALVVFAQSI